MSILVLALIDIVILAAWTPMAFALRSRVKAFSLGLGVLAAVSFIASFHQVLAACDADPALDLIVWGILAALFIVPMGLSALIDHGHHIRAIVWAFGAMAVAHLLFANVAKPLACMSPQALPPLGLIAAAFVANGLAATFLGPLAALTQTMKGRYFAIGAGLLLLVASMEGMRVLMG